LLRWLLGPWLARRDLRAMHNDLELVDEIVRRDRKGGES
jgi:hypothetical protein